MTTKKTVSEVQVRVAVLSHYFEVAERLGLNPQNLLTKVGLSRAVLSKPDQLIPSRAAVDLLELSAQATQCDTFGLLMAESRQFSDLGPVSLLLTHQRTVRDALNTTIQYRHLLNKSLAMHIEQMGKFTEVREEVISVGSRSSRQANELAVAVLCFMFRAWIGPLWHPQSVSFMHSAPADQEVHKRVFRCKLRFGMDFHGMLCKSIDLDHAIAVADPVMARYAQSFIDSIPGGHSGSVLQDVRKSIYLLLPMGRASVQQVALSLNMPVRRMQRRLDEEGQSFSALVNEVRVELAQRYIANPSYPLGRIAELLGYSNHSAFTRWSIAQFKRTPQDMRTKTAAFLSRAEDFRRSPAPNAPAAKP